MSTRIYNGRIMRLPIGAAYERLLLLKPEIEAKGEAVLARVVADHLARRFDAISLKMARAKSGESTARELLCSVFRTIEERRRKIESSGRRDPEIDLKFELFLFPYGERTLLIANTESSELLRAFDVDPAVEDYGWWNSVDKPENLSDGEWSQREADWDAVLPGAGVPAERCLVFQLFDGLLHTRNLRRKIWLSLPAVDTRLQREAQDAFLIENYDISKGVSQIFALTETFKNDAELQEKFRAAIEPAIVPINEDTSLQARI